MFSITRHSQQASFQLAAAKKEIEVRAPLGVWLRPMRASALHPRGPGWRVEWWPAGLDARGTAPPRLR
jgi:hypothetical protein